jgi:mannose-1-phosphate guanylyltransferase
MADFHAVILAGGSGTRFWPASRRDRPKHFLPLGPQGQTLLGATIARLAPLARRERLWIVTNAAQAEQIGRLLPEFPAGQLLLEPEPRDTAPAVAFAAAQLEARAPGSVVGMFPADHRIDDEAAFRRCVERAIALAADGATLVTLGIAPDRPATGYGYIELGAAIDAQEPVACHAAAFREKPDRATAERFVAGRRHLWNSGMLLWSWRALRDAMAGGDPALAAAGDAMLAAARAGDRPALARAFATAPRISIDYAVLERAPRVAVVRAEFGWDDLGSFVTLGRAAAPDAAGNVVLAAGGAAALLEQSERCTVYAEGDRTIALFGTADLVVVAVDDAVLVCPRHRAEELKQLVRQLPPRRL